MEKPRYCRVCRTLLTTENAYSSTLKNKQYVCKECARKRAKAYAKEQYRLDPEYRRKKKEAVSVWVAQNRKDFNAYQRDYYSRNYIREFGLCIKAKKRAPPENCELCQKKRKKLSWHHWDSAHPEYGLWVCFSCHFLAEIIDHLDYEKLLKDYLTLKNKIPSYDATKPIPTLICS